jgi:hypothetical protein
LVRQTITRASRQVDITAEVQQAVASKDNAMVADVLAQEAKEPGRDYLLVDGPLASQLNAIGVLFGLIFRAAGK